MSFGITRPNARKRAGVLHKDTHAKQQSYSCGSLFRRKNTPLKDPAPQHHVPCRAHEHNRIVGRKRPADPPPCCQGGRSRWNCKNHTHHRKERSRSLLSFAQRRFAHAVVADKTVLPRSSGPGRRRQFSDRQFPIHAARSQSAPRCYRRC
jgi:hypothetical protein